MDPVAFRECVLTLTKTIQQEQQDLQHVDRLMAGAKAYLAAMDHRIQRSERRSIELRLLLNRLRPRP